MYFYIPTFSFQHFAKNMHHVCFSFYFVNRTSTYLFFFFRRLYNTKMFITPVILFSILYNFSKFWELEVKEDRSITFENGTKVSEADLDEDTIANFGPLNVSWYLEPTTLRTDPMYFSIYILWMNLIFNILGPFIVLATLNHIVSITNSIK